MALLLLLMLSFGLQFSEFKNEQLQRGLSTFWPFGFEGLARPNNSTNSSIVWQGVREWRKELMDSFYKWLRSFLIYMTPV